MSNPLNIAIVVTGPCYGTQDAITAYNYVKAAIAEGHTIQRVFFYNDGVLNGSKLSMPASDEFDLHKAWCELALLHKFGLDICSSAALRRGIVDAAETERLSLDSFNLQAPFELTGLGQLAESLVTADRVIQF